ncbi:hypothetical protein [Xylanibacter caecicola]|uniref:hypothetical protein n=1 Tax=Xylanibacter caecicola TaxID=2736294 RepID=UPI00259AA691|nr:hypothetical protein [Xylanibacter caecicola]
MKHIFSLIIPFIAFFLTGTTCTVKEKAEGIVIHRTDYGIEKSEEELIYFTDGKDTLDFFCIFHKKYNSIYIRFNIEIPDPFSPVDTSAVSETSYEPNYKKVNYSRQIYLLCQTLNHLASQNKAFTIKHIDIDMMNTGIANVEITNEFNKLGGKKCLSSIVYDNRIRHDIDSILAPYHLKVDKTFVSEGIYFFLPKKYFIKENAVDDLHCMPDSLLEFYIGMNIKDTSTK